MERYIQSRQIVCGKKRGGEGRGLISAERCIKEEENSLGFHVANSEENLIYRGIPS